MASPLHLGPYAHGPHRSLSNQPFPKQSQPPTFMAQCGVVQTQGWGEGGEHPQSSWMASWGSMLVQTWKEG